MSGRISGIKSNSGVLAVMIIVLTLCLAGCGSSGVSSSASSESSSAQDSAKVASTDESSQAASSEESSQATSEELSSVEAFTAPTDFTSEEARQEMIAKSASFPAKYDLRDVDGQCYVTPVRLQNPFGDCWGFAAIASAETAILGSVLADDPQAYKTLNLSEKQLAYFSHMYVDDPSSPQNGEGMHVFDKIAENGISSEDIYAGGTTILATNTFASGIGPVSESRGVEFEYRGTEGKIDKKTASDGTEYDFSYSADDDWNLDEDSRYRQDYVLKEAYLLPSPAQFKEEYASETDNAEDSSASSGTTEPDSASASSDTPLPEDSSISSDATLSDAASASEAAPEDADISAESAESDDVSSDDIPDFSDFSGMPDELANLGNFNVSYSYNEAATAAIKDQLLQKRAVTIAFHADTSKPWEDDFKAEYMNPETWAHYTWKGDMPNHAVTIVGWDDDYPASNFLSDHQPEGNGAWLVKNSWGSGENEFPDRGYGLWGIPVEKKDADGNTVLDEDGNPVMVGSGYFWLSYYDQTINDPEAFIFDTTWNDPTLGKEYFLDDVHRYQHDLMPATTVNAAKSSEELKSANVFTAEKDEYLICVSFEIASPGTTVDYEVYLLSPGYESPVDGSLMASGEKTYQYGGYYMEFLNPYVTLKEGQSYSIVVTQKLDTGEYAMNAPMGMGKDSQITEAMSELAAPQYSVAVVNECESLVYADGKWQDWSSEDVRLGLMAADAMARDMLKIADSQYDNFPLKGFAIDALVEGSLQLSDDSQELHLSADGSSTTLDVKISGPASETLDLSDLYITWNLAPGGEELVSLEPNKDGTHAQVKGLKAGKTFLFVNDVALGTTIIPIEVV